MTFSEFIQKYTGVGIDTDGAYGFQCMDLMHKYNQQVLGLADLRILAAANAKSVYLNFPAVYGNQYFDRTANTPTGVPQAGDIMFWDGADGHVAVYKEGDVNSFTSFDQNYPVGSTPHLQHHTYTNVLGWLRIKQAVKLVSSVDILAIRNGPGSDGEKLDKIAALCK